MFDKSVKITATQHKAALFAVAVASDLLAHAAPTDETPLEITLGEVLEVAGKRLAGAALGN